jgi:hypothetical protein
LPAPEGAEKMITLPVAVGCVITVMRFVRLNVKLIPEAGVRFNSSKNPAGGTVFLQE